MIESITSENVQQLIDNQIISEGMLPKINNCMHAVNHNVQKVCIGKTEMLFDKKSIYTTISK